jgi:hypothetical protein
MRATIILALIVLAAGCTQKIPLKDIKTFDDCNKAGYTTDSYPRQCKTPDGRTFTSETDLFDASIDYTCNEETDCQLVNRLNGFSCCWKGACDKIDYTVGQWIPVNKDWYKRQRTQKCPKEADCGPAPECPTQQPTGDYKSTCMNSKCVKVPTANP